MNQELLLMYILFIHSVPLVLLMVGSFTDGMMSDLSYSTQKTVEKWVTTVCVTCYLINWIILLGWNAKVLKEGL